MKVDARLRPGRGGEAHDRQVVAAERDGDGARERRHEVEELGDEGRGEAD